MLEGRGGTASTCTKRDPSRSGPGSRRRRRRRGRGPSKWRSATRYTSPVRKACPLYCGGVRSSHCSGMFGARPWQPPAVRSPQMVVSLKGVAGLTCHNAPETRQEAPCEPSHQGAVRRCNIWAKDARFGGSGTGCQRHFVYYFEAHLPRTQAPRGRPPRRRRGRATRHNLRRPIRVEGHQYPAQWARGGEAGEGRVVGQ
jgi:hypothetical protein